MNARNIVDCIWLAIQENADTSKSNIMVVSPLGKEIILMQQSATSCLSRIAQMTLQSQVILLGFDQVYQLFSAEEKVNIKTFDIVIGYL